jgi:MscS family membrane protein
MNTLVMGASQMLTWLGGIINYEILTGNPLWRFALVLLIVLATLVAGRIVQFSVIKYTRLLASRRGDNVISLTLKTLANPIYVAILGAGVFLAKLPLYFHDDRGLHTSIGQTWVQIAHVIAAVATAYALYKLVDVAEHYLNRLVGKTQSHLDDMLVPAMRKALRITIAIIAVLMISENILGTDQIKSLILSAGIGGIAIALAARETIANFFGSITIFADRPFQIGDRVKIHGHLGDIEEVGFRSTRVRTIKGHLVTIPNSVIANETIDNLGQRPFIRRTSNITITYDCGHAGARRAVEIIKEILANVPEVNLDPKFPPRVYFSEFNDYSLNIYMSYWIKPPELWRSYEVNERVNFEIARRFEAEHIDFAFPTQTLHVKRG